MFKQAKRLGILDGVNPVQDVSHTRERQSRKKHTPTLSAEVKAMLALLSEPARTVVLYRCLDGTPQE